MKKIGIIILREYITRVRRKSFLVTTLLAPLGFLLLIFASALLSTYSQGAAQVAVIDDSGLFRDVPIPDISNPVIYFHRISDSYQSLSERLAQDSSEKAPYEAIIYIPPNFNINTPNHPGIVYRYSKHPGIAKQQAINQRMTDAVQRARMTLLHLSEQDMAQMQQKVKLQFESLDHKAEHQGYTDAAAVVGMVMGFAIYIALFIYGAMIMKGVMEEKHNRIVEVLASSVKPFQLLMGKILGIGAVGLTQFALWIFLMLGVNLLAGLVLGIAIGSQPPSTAQLQNAPVDADTVMAIVQNISALPLTRIFILFPLYFLGGFFLYGSLFAAAGSAIGEDGDQQSLMFPITIPIIISIIIAINVINNPDSALSFWGSIIPFTSPIVMSALLPFRPDWWQVALSLLLLILGFIFTTYLAARIYRTGILMYGKKIKMKELMRWLFSKD